MNRRNLITALAATSLLTAYPGTSVAQSAETYPNRPVKLVVSYAAGNIADVLARSVAQKLAEHWKQPVVVENRPGQGGSLGAQIVAKSTPDGYTLLFSAMAAIAINPHVYQRVGYDPIADFVPITAVARTSASILYAGLDVKANTFAELLALSKAQPGTLNYGTAGSGTVPHLNMEALKGLTGLDVTHVPYKAAAAVLTDVVGGRIQIAQESSAVVLPQLRAGKIKAIAVTGSERLRELKDIPALSEIVPQFEPVQPWMGVLAPAGTPATVVQRVADAVREALASEGMTARLQQIGVDAIGSTPRELADTLRTDMAIWSEAAKAAKLKME